jgi:hypothetical protein
VTETEACVRYMESWCRRGIRCGNWSDMNECMVYALDCPDLYFGPGSLRTVDGMLACAEDWEAWACHAATVPPCAVGGTQTAGQPCINASQCEGGACNAGQDGCGTCLPVAELGEACSVTTVACDHTQYCDSTGVCAVEGELMPDPPPMTPTEPYSTVGEACGGGAPPCHQAAECVSGVCAASGSMGAFPRRCLM